MPAPPPPATRFLRWYCHPELLDEVEGDLYELFQRRVEMKGLWKAKVLYWLNVLMFLHPDYIRKRKDHYPVNHTAMFRNYLKISFRNLTKNKGFSLINIGGLAAGMTVAMLISLWIYDELSFNQYHQNYDRIAQVMRHEIGHEVKHTNTSHVTGLGTLLASEYGNHFEHVVMVRAGVEERVIALGEKKFTQNGYFMQPEGAEMLSLNMIHGTREGLRDMHAILLSESLAKKIFGDADPMNQIITMDARWDLKVTGVYEDLPKNSAFNEASYFAPLDLYLDGWATLDAWDNYHMYIYAQLTPQADFEQVSAVIKDAMLPHVNEETAQSEPEVFLLPMRQWHLQAKFENGVQVMSEPMKFVWFYGIIGVFVLLLACINFMNLSTARSEKRAKEVGIRKTIGSLRSQLIGQFLVESLQVSAFAFVLALGLAALALPWFNAIAGKEMRMLWTHPWFWVAGIGFTLFTALLAGSYPAFYLSSFNPIRALKGSFRAGRFAAAPRKVLVVIQFTVSIALIIGTVIVYQQIQFAKNRPVGYSGDGLLTLPMRSPEFAGKYNALRNELKKTGAVAEIAEANYPLTNAKGWNGGFDWEGKDPATDTSFNTIFVTHEYGETVGWDLAEGRDFSRAFASDKSGIILNESALKIMGLEDPVGEVVYWNPGWREAGEYQIWVL